MSRYICFIKLKYLIFLNGESIMERDIDNTLLVIRPICHFYHNTRSIVSTDWSHRVVGSHLSVRSRVTNNCSI
jgi:hypothetical protein